MLTQGFKQASSDAGVFIYRHKDGKIVITLVYVDDRIFLGHNQSLVDKKKHACLEHWECRCKGGSGGCLIPHTSKYNDIVFSCTVGNV